MVSRVNTNSISYKLYKRCEINKEELSKVDKIKKEINNNTYKIDLNKTAKAMVDYYV